MQEKLHITEHEFHITLADRIRKNGYSPLCLWFTGLSGSGKSTLANLVEQELFKENYCTYILDGDNIRKGLNKDLNFTEESRVENIRRIGSVAKLMCDAGLIVLAAFVSPFIKDRNLLRETLGPHFVEIFVDTPIDICEQRDVKGLYKKARNGEISNFTGVSSPFEKPLNADIHIQTDRQNIDESVKMIVDKILPKIKNRGSKDAEILS
jgi:adenylylsulfate kinase